MNLRSLVRTERNPNQILDGCVVRSKATMRCRSSPVGVLLAAVAVLVLGACGDGSDGDANATTTPPPPTTMPTTTTTVPTIDYPGRLLLHDEGPDDGLLQLTADSLEPVLASRPPSDAGDWTLAAVSPDGSHVLYATPEQLLRVIGDGMDQFPGIAAADVTNAFSPDGKRIAFVAMIGGDEQVVVHDLAGLSTVTVLEPTCASYGAGIGAGVCGALGDVIWIDSSTLFVSHFAGEMPSSVSCPPGQDGCTQPSPNTYSVITVDGNVVRSVAASDGRAVSAVSVSGRTVVLDDQTWLDLDELAAGTAIPKPLPENAEALSLSPDGTKIVVAGSPLWQLVDLRTGAVQDLGTRAITTRCPTCGFRDDAFVWSPDGTHFAVLDSSSLASDDNGVTFDGEVRIHVVPASSDAGGIAAIIPIEAGGVTGDLSLVRWVR